MEVYKGKGSQSDIANYRDVMVADASDKAATGLLMDAAVPVVSAMVGDTQLGAGFNNGSTATRHLIEGVRGRCSGAEGVCRPALC